MFGGKGKGKRQKREPAVSGAIRKFSLLPFAFSLSTDAFFSNLLAAPCPAPFAWLARRARSRRRNAVLLSEDMRSYLAGSRTIALIALVAFDQPA